MNEPSIRNYFGEAVKNIVDLSQNTEASQSIYVDWLEKAWKSPWMIKRIIDSDIAPGSQFTVFLVPAVPFRVFLNKQESASINVKEDPPILLINEVISEIHSIRLYNALSTIVLQDNIHFLGDHFRHAAGKLIYFYLLHNEIIASALGGTSILEENYDDVDPLDTKSYEAMYRLQDTGWFDLANSMTARLELDKILSSWESHRHPPIVSDKSGYWMYSGIPPSWTSHEELMGFFENGVKKGVVKVPEGTYTPLLSAEYKDVEFLRKTPDALPSLKKEIASAIKETAKSLLGGDSCSNHFRREGQFWVIIFDGQRVILQHYKGLTYLQVLLRSNGRDVSVLDILRESGDISESSVGERDIDIVSLNIQDNQTADAEPIIDAETIEACKGRIRQIKGQLVSLSAQGKDDRVEKKQKELLQIEKFLSSSTRPGGKTKTISNELEKTRKSVSNNIDRAIKTIMQSHESLGRHLSQAISTGNRCSYSPSSDPKWVL